MIVIFGAGNIGLSFVGQIFARSGEEVVFADANPVVVERLASVQGYTVELLHPDGAIEHHEIRPVQAIDARDQQALADRLAARPLLATAVGARAFPLVLDGLSRAARHAGVSLASLDLIAAENIHDPRAIATRELGANAPRVHPCSVGKMVPLQDLGDSGPIRVRCEAYNTLIVDGSNWHNPIPLGNGWLHPVDHIEAWMDRKLYVHNLGHAACAWRSRVIDPAIGTIAEAVARPDIRTHTESVMRAAGAVVAAAYPEEFTDRQMNDHVDDLLYRFANPALGDTIERVGRDVPRKLGRDERVIGALRLAARLSGEPGGASALLALAPEIVRDACAFEGLERRTAVSDLCGLHDDSRIDRMVIAAITDG